MVLARGGRARWFRKSVRDRAGTEDQRCGRRRSAQSGKVERRGRRRSSKDARGFAGERFRGAREEDLGQDRAGARALKQRDQPGG